MNNSFGMARERAIERAKEAKKLLDNPLVQESFASMRREAERALEEAESPEAAFRAVVYLKQARRAMSYFRIVLAQGESAAQAHAREEKEREIVSDRETRSTELVATAREACAQYDAIIASRQSAEGAST